MPKSILVVDDSPIVLESVEEALAERYQVRLCEDPRLIPNFLLQGDPVDLVLLDVNMPELSGPEAVAALRRMGLRSSKFVLYSSEPRDVLERLVVEVAVCGAISKSTPMNLLGDKIERYLEEVSLAGVESIVFAREPLRSRLGTELQRLGIETELHDPVGVDRRIRSSTATLVVLEEAAFKNCAERISRLRKRAALASRRLLLIGACAGETCLDEGQLDPDTISRVLTDLLA